MNILIGDVAATSFVTLYCHAIESQSRDPILNDPKAVEITHELNKTFFNSNIKLERELAEGKLDKQLVVHVAIRAKQYDKYVGKFLENSPEGVVINIGCGLDSRFLRVDNGKVIFYDLDLPEVIENYKMQHRGHLGKDATYNFGVRDSKEMEGWNAGIQFLDDWSYFDSEEKKLGWLKMFRNSELFRKTQWTVHYKLN